ncbi:hypothetical protein A2U01_0108981, partial [Trifolium medium]|nr:hypothetical protein [Trifolium medium]
VPASEKFSEVLMFQASDVFSF